MCFLYSIYQSYIYGDFSLPGHIGPKCSAAIRYIITIESRIQPFPSVTL